MPLRVHRGRSVCVILSCVCLCHRAASFTYLGEVLRCPHKRIVTITKVHRKKHYTRGNNTIPYKLARLVIFESLKWKYSFATNSTLFMKLGLLLYVRCRHRSVNTVRALLSNKKFLFQLTNNADSYGIVNRYRWMNVYIGRNNMQVQFVRFRKKISPLFTFSVSNRVIQCNIAQCYVHVYLIFEATDSKQYRPQNA